MASLRTAFSFLALVFVIFTFSEAREILVGGKENSWTIPSPQSEILNQWAEKLRFKVGDELVWKYDGKADSVLQVTKEDYESCKTSKPIKEHKDGNTKIELDRSGPFYFVSGAEGHCEKDQKLVVVVLSEAHGAPKGDYPAPMSMPAPAPAPAPANGAADHGLRGRSLGALVGLGVLVGMVLV